jgi:class 3 adenylate cyclase
MLTSGSYLSRIAENSLDKTAIFSIENHRYGLISHPRRRLGDLGLERICAWLAASNLPVSEERFFGQQKILIEGRPGVAQFNNFLIAISSKSVIEEQILALGTWFVRFLLIFLLVIFAVAYLTAQDIIFPIRNLIYGMKEIDRQNFFFRIDSGREDELGELCNSYNQLAQGLAEKAVMGKMLSQSAISQVAGQSKGRQAEKSQHAILLVGIPGFASWLGSGAVTDLFADLQKQSAEICRIISEEGGEIDKFIGDKLLAIFYAKSGKCAVESALKAIRSVIRAEEKGLLPFPAALGLNYGQVISGFLGVGAKRDFTIIGDAVNVAARIEKEAEKLRYRRALISESCFDLLEEKSELRLYCEIQLKGKSQILKIFSFV